LIKNGNFRKQRALVQSGAAGVGNARFFLRQTQKRQREESGRGIMEATETDRVQQVLSIPGWRQVHE